MVPHARYCGSGIALIPQPLTVATNWGTAAVLPLALLCSSVAIAFVAYRWALARAHTLSARAIAAVLAAGLVAAWCSPVVFSSDVYAYAAYGELALHGLSPYAPIPHDFNGPLVRAAQLQWGSAFPICVYGPLFVVFARWLVGSFSAAGPMEQLNAFRVVASMALALCIPLSIAAYDGDRVARYRAAATIALNPVAIWCAAEGHNDALAIAVALAGFATVRVLRIPVGAAIVAVAALIKAPAAAAVAALAWTDRRCRIVGAVSLAIVAALSWPLIAGTFAHVAAGARYAPQASVQAILAPLGEPVAIAVAAILAGILACRGVARLRAGAMQGWIWLGLAGWALIPNPYPWYGMWLLALAAMAPMSRAGAAATALSLTSLLRYVPDAVGTPAAAGSVALAILASLPLLWSVLLPVWYTKRPA